jgi:uncharacterized protein (DUF488 family)
MRAIATIGVYGFDAAGFLETLHRADVQLLLDVRQRRAVRGAQYAWANSLRLQTALEHAGVAYQHHRELAPTTELRQLQYREDDRLGVGKRTRTELSNDYKRRYEAEILDRVDIAALVVALPVHGVSALLCVERDADACHRSIIARRMAQGHRVSVTHLVPEIR